MIPTPVSRWCAPVGTSSEGSVLSGGRTCNPTSLPKRWRKLLVFPPSVGCIDGHTYSASSDRAKPKLLSGRRVGELLLRRGNALTSSVVDSFRCVSPHS
jgi:hypothetical protein